METSVGKITFDSKESPRKIRDESGNILGKVQGRLYKVLLTPSSHPSRTMKTGWVHASYGKVGDLKTQMKELYKKLKEHNLRDKDPVVDVGEFCPFIFAEDYQGKSIETKVMNELLEKFKAEKFVAAYGLITSVPIQKFYENMGFKRADEFSYFKLL